MATRSNLSAQLDPFHIKQNPDNPTQTSSFCKHLASNKLSIYLNFFCFSAPGQWGDGASTFEILPALVRLTWKWNTEKNMISRLRERKGKRSTIMEGIGNVAIRCDDPTKEWVKFLSLLHACALLFLTPNLLSVNFLDMHWNPIPHCIL